MLSRALCSSRLSAAHASRHGRSSRPLQSGGLSSGDTRIIVRDISSSCAQPFSSLVGRDEFGSRPILGAGALVPQGRMPGQWHQHQQVRYMGRNDGRTKFNKERQPTRKQRKKYTRRVNLQKIETEKHNAPGSKRAEMKNWMEDRLDLLRKDAKGELLELEDNPEFNQYTMGHAMVEDLMGNTAHLTSTETPRITDESTKYDRQLALVQHMIQNDGKLPSDDELSLLVRAYRDKFGGSRLFSGSYSGSSDKNKESKKSSVGVAKVLQLLTKDLGIPASQLKERTLTAVMTCALRPAEARKVLDKMVQTNLPLEYAYSILVDLYAKRGDFVEARLVMDEMSLKHELQPPIAAYTSLIAACHRAAAPSTTPGAIKAHATEEAWKAWTEMRIVGLSPDAMAYGAIIRFFSMRGRPEKCMDMIDEMITAFQVRPTTLIFTAALHAVAQSHRTALRFEGGKSRKNLRAQGIAAHHGRMTRQILIQAEQAEVDQDDGFVSALLLCAGAAGDSATAKAIMLASEVRRKDWLRPIGSNEYLKKNLQPPGQNLIDQPLMDSAEAEQRLMLQSGEGQVEEENVEKEDVALQNKLMSSDDNESVGNFLKTNPEMKGLLEKRDPQLKAILERNNPFSTEDPFGTTDEPDGILPPQVKNEGQVLRSLLMACAQSMEAKGLGDLWGGPKNKGFLCEQTQKAIVTREVPRYRDNSVPGMNSIDVGLGSVEWDEDEDVDKMSKRLRRTKWMGMKQNDQAHGNTLDDMDPDIASGFDEERAARDAKLLGHDERPDFDDKFSNEGVYADDERVRIDMNDSDTFEASFIDNLDDDDDEEDSAEAFSEVDVSEEQAYGAPTDDDEEVSEEEWVSRQQHSMIRRQSDLVKEHQEKYALDDFALAMPPGLPAHRIEKLRKVVNANLGYTSMLEMIPLMRENIPDRPPLSWLQKKNLQNAHFVMKRMEEKELLNDERALNHVLQVTASSNKLNKALAFHNTEFRRRGLTPDQRSDRIMVQMLLRNKRMPRALSLKDEVERDGRELDRHSYGSFVQYYSNHNELGSALMMVKECVAVHGFPPSESTLSKVRMLCRKKKLTEETQLEEMIGKDPLTWLRVGISKKKRDRKYKNNRDVMKVNSMMLKI
jgi:pentatricopeptide repeat protein